MACKLSVAIHLLQASHIAKFFRNRKGFAGGDIYKVN